MSNDLVESNYEQVILDLLARVKRLEGGSVVAQELSEISSDMGLIEGGELRIHSDWADPKEPGDGFSGVRILGAFEYPEGSGTYYAIVGVNNDALTFGLSSVDGSAIFCSGNATIDQDGISGTDLLNWLVRQTATVGSNERIGRMGFSSDGTDPLWTIEYQGTTESEKLDNGDFEDGDFTSWNKTTETNAFWEILPGAKRSGTYGLYGWVNVTSGNDDTLVLTSNRITDISAGNYYLAKTYFSRASVLPVTPATGADTVKAEIKWYDHASAGSLLQTDEVFSLSGYSAYPSAYTAYEKNTLAPTGALSCVYVITITATHTGGTYRAYGMQFDDLSLSGVSEPQRLQLTDDGLATTNGMYPYQVSMFPYQCVCTFELSYAVFAHPFYFLCYGGAAADGDNYDYYFMAEKGTYTLEYLYAKNTAGGKGDIYVDGTKVTSLVEHYAASQTLNQKSQTTGITIAYAGRHLCRLKVNGKNASSTDYQLYHSAVILRRTGA